MDSTRLTADARRYLPDADSIRVEEVMSGMAPFKLVAWKGGHAHGKIAA